MQFIFRRDPAQNDSIAVDQSTEPRLVSRKISTFDDPVVSSEQAYLLRNRPGGLRMIASYHGHCDSCPPAGFDGFGYLRTWRILNRYQPEKIKSSLYFFGCLLRIDAANRPPGYRQHAESTGRHVLQGRFSTISIKA
jgi:hypothetical protein